MHSLLVRIPWLYERLSSFRRFPNYEKILYLRTVKKGSIVIDAGANCGYFTTLFSMMVGKSGEVHAFEPVPESYALLKANTERRTFNVITNKLALGKKKGKASIAYDPCDSEKASLIRTSSIGGQTKEVQVIPLDDYIQEKNIRRLDFIKCDVEGYELQVLKGMKKSLTEFTPQLSIEVTLSLKERVSMLNFLEQMGYDSFRVIEKDYPVYQPSKTSMGDYFYLHAFSSKVSELRSQA